MSWLLLIYLLFFRLDIVFAHFCYVCVNPRLLVQEGEFANGQREGHGSYKFSDGGQYTGSWKDGRTYWCFSTIHVVCTLLCSPLNLTLLTLLSTRTWLQQDTMALVPAHGRMDDAIVESGASKLWYFLVIPGACGVECLGQVPCLPCGLTVFPFFFQ